jgi:hypothetical protein
MISGKDWKSLSQSKKATAERLMRSKEWVLAAEQLGYSLECALKAACCKSLRLNGYPPVKANKEMTLFRTHEFDSLLIFSGLNDILGANSLAWGNFVTYYPGVWPEMRYDLAIETKFTESKVKELYALLYDGENSIIGKITRKRKW